MNSTTMKHPRSCLIHSVVFALAAALSGPSAFGDSFGDGSNRFHISFVTIAGNASSANGTNISQYAPGDTYYRTFTDPGYDYRIGVYEINNGQWQAFVQGVGGTVLGAPSSAYDEQDDHWPNPASPAGNTSWYEALQFVNWLNTSTGHHAAYKFNGTPGTTNYSFDEWDLDEATSVNNVYRHKDAFYFLPTEDEWVKAAYWNGQTLQDYATPTGNPPLPGDADNLTGGWNYDNAIGARDWDSALGHVELNGTHNMMGNVSEQTESPYYGIAPATSDYRTIRGGSYGYTIDGLAANYRKDYYASWEGDTVGFRVASHIPEPATVSLLGLGGLAGMVRSRRR